MNKLESIRNYDRTSSLVDAAHAMGITQQEIKAFEDQIHDDPAYSVELLAIRVLMIEKKLSQIEISHEKAI